MNIKKTAASKLKIFFEMLRFLSSKEHIHLYQNILQWPQAVIHIVESMKLSGQK